MTDKELGLKAFEKFHKWNRTFHPNTYKLSFDEFLKTYGKKTDIYLDGVGGGIREASLSDSRIDTAMRSLALASKGRVLENPLRMFDYMMNEATQLSWVDASKFIFIESVKDVATGAESIGKSIITTGKILNFLLPAIALIFVYFIVNQKTGGTLDRAVKGLRR